MSDDKTNEIYNPEFWCWDPNNHIVVYVHRRLWAETANSGRIEYAEVSVPRITPLLETFALGNLNRYWIAAKDLIALMQHHEINY